ncbi:acyl carrier protein [Embleya sp. AB8]|uniref:acyl carrier protein n=1 Tax=Embleya sp. AB8 TaxID=3156304 RepID=UPI003C764436
MATPQMPEPELRASLLAIWQEVLKTDELTPDDDFFEAGGHSLSAMTICARAKRVLGTELEPGNFYTLPTVRAMSRELADRHTRAAAASESESAVFEA